MTYGAYTCVSREREKKMHVGRGAPRQYGDGYRKVKELFQAAGGMTGERDDVACTGLPVSWMPVKFPEYYTASKPPEGRRGFGVVREDRPGDVLTVLLAQTQPASRGERDEKYKKNHPVFRIASPDETRPIARKTREPQT